MLTAFPAVDEALDAQLAALIEANRRARGWVYADEDRGRRCGEDGRVNLAGVCSSCWQGGENRVACDAFHRGRW